MSNERQLFVMGDIHGFPDKLVRHLRYAGLANSNAEWTGGAAQLWFMGDFTDRGPDGISVIEFVMRLQADAARKGGTVGALLGNHDVGILTAKFFPDAPSGGAGGTFYRDWVAYGGTVSDLAKLQAHHIEWLKNLPALAVVDDYLLVHADAMFYLLYGETLADVNAATRAVLHSEDTAGWDTLMGYAGQRYAFDERKPGAVMRASQLLANFGGKHIFHGHTPIPKLSGEPLDRVTRAYTYCDDLVTDVDGGIYLGGAGFVHQVPLKATLPTHITRVNAV
jgi:hypothetical protein